MEKLWIGVVNRAVGSIGQEQVAMSGISNLSIQAEEKKQVRQNYMGPDKVAYQPVGLAICHVMHS